MITLKEAIKREGKRANDFEQLQNPTAIMAEELARHKQYIKWFLELQMYQSIYPNLFEDGSGKEEQENKTRSLEEQSRKAMETSILFIEKGELPLIGSDNFGIQPLNESGQKEFYEKLDISAINRITRLMIFESVMLTLLVIFFVIALAGKI